LLTFAASWSLPPMAQRGAHHTPFGARADGCTLEVESGSRIDEAVPGGGGVVLVTQSRRTAAGALVTGAWEPAAKAFFYPTPGHCHADMAGLLERRRRQPRHARRAATLRGVGAPAGRPSRAWSEDNFTCDALPCDGWVDNAGGQLPEINGEGEAFPRTIGQVRKAPCRPRSWASFNLL
jgi:hypothetical protein